MNYFCNLLYFTKF